MSHMETQTHTYDTIVPEPFNPPLRDLVGDWCAEVTADVGEFGDVYHSKVTEVENESRSGFIPYTNGGFEGIAYASLHYAHGSGDIPDVVQPYLDRELEQVREEWDAKHTKHTFAWIFETPDLENDLGQGNLFGRGKTNERDHWREEYFQFQDSIISEGGTYFYKVRALFFDQGNRRNESGKPEVFFMVGVNTDFEYGRDTIPWLRHYGGNPQQSSWVWEKNVPVGEITPELIEQLKKEALEALRNA